MSKYENIQPFNIPSRTHPTKSHFVPNNNIVSAPHSYLIFRSLRTPKLKFLFHSFIQNFKKQQNSTWLIETQFHRQETNVSHSLREVQLDRGGITAPKCKGWESLEWCRQSICSSQEHWDDWKLGSEADLLLGPGRKTGRGLQTKLTDLREGRGQGGNDGTKGVCKAHLNAETSNVSISTYSQRKKVCVCV